MAGVRVSMNRGEDKPLLVSIVDNKRSGKGSDDETYIDHKYGKPMATFKKWQYDNKNGNGRSKHTMMGAANVVNRWPDHLAMCWMIAVAICMIIIVGVFMLESTFKNSSPLHFSYMTLQQHCKLNHENLEPSDKTNIYLHIILNDRESFNFDKYDSVFDGIKEHYPKHMINIILLHNDTIDVNYHRNARFNDWELFNNRLDQPKFFQTSSAEEKPILVHNKQEVAMYENVKLIRSTFSTYFKNSPLRYRWKIMAPEMMPFILRVLTLWEKGGITMPWQLFLDKTAMYYIDYDEYGDMPDIAINPNKTDTLEVQVKKQLINDIQDHMDVGVHMDIQTNDSYNVSGSYSDYSYEESASEKTTPKPKKTPKIADNAKENLDNAKQKIRLAGVNSDSVIIESSMSKMSDSTIMIKDRKDKERLFIPDNQLIKKLDPEINFPSDSDVIDREIEKINKSPKNPAPKKAGDAVKKLDSDIIEETESRRHRARRDLNVKQQDLGKFNNKQHKDFIPPKTILEYQSSDSLSSDYNYDYDSDYEPYSGLNVQEPFKSNRGKKKTLNFELEWSSEIYTDLTRSSDKKMAKIIEGLTDSTSEESSESSENYFKESQAYVYHSMFEMVNVFASPSRTNLALDKFGYYFATKRPCHAFLGTIISNLQSSYDLADPNTVVSDSLKTFCKDTKFDCTGLSLL